MLLDWLKQLRPAKPHLTLNQVKLLTVEGSARKDARLLNAAYEDILIAARRGKTSVRVNTTPGVIEQLEHAGFNTKPDSLTGTYTEVSWT